MSLMSGVYRQFSKPQGALGHVVGWILANRASNLRRNRWTIDLLDLTPSDRVLEIGFGPGVAIGLAAARVPHGTVVGLDHSAVMLAQARRRNARLIASGRLALHLGGFESLPALNQSFDKVFAVNVLHFLPDRDAALHAVKRIMQPGGTLAITHQPRHVGATAADADRFAAVLVQEMTQAGFHGARVEKLDVTPLPAVCVLMRS